MVPGSSVRKRLAEPWSTKRHATITSKKAQVLFLTLDVYVQRELQVDATLRIEDAADVHLNTPN